MPEVKERTMRMTISYKCTEDGLKRIEADVGPNELEEILKYFDDITILQWGRYGIDGWAYMSPDHKRIEQLIENNKKKFKKVS